MQSALELARSQATEQTDSGELRRRFAQLTDREREVMGHAVADKINKQIAAKLGTVLQTIKVHRMRVMQKIGVTFVAGSVRAGDRLGLGRGVYAASAAVAGRRMRLPTISFIWTRGIGPRFNARLSGFSLFFHRILTNNQVRPSPLPCTPLPFSDRFSRPSLLPASFMLTPLTWRLGSQRHASPAPALPSSSRKIGRAHV